MRIRLLTDPHLRDTAYVVSVLKSLGFRASGGPVAGERYNLLASNSRNHTQISVGGTLTDYPAPSNIIQTWLSCDSFRPGSGSNANRAGFCNPSVDAGIERALALETSDPKAANRLWAQIDREIVDQAPWLPTVNLNTVDFLSGSPPSMSGEAPSQLAGRAPTTPRCTGSRLAVVTRSLGLPPLPSARPATEGTGDEER
jgi:ABC-type transport system substrate-binding protein